MNIEELVVLLPCHSLEDFPVHHEGDEADGLLAAWSGLWHPALIAACGKVPVWFRADAPPEKLKDRLVVVPQVSDSLLLPGWPTRAKAEGARLIRKTAKRTDVVAAALAALDTSPTVADELVADFLALGTGFLMVELLTRQMRYMSNLDEVRFANDAVAAAKAAVEGREDDARTSLRNAFETLYEGRERFYPVDNFLIDLTLTADTTLGPSLVRELRGETPFNLLLSGKLLERLAGSAPASLEALKHAVDRRVACVVGGEFEERETPLLSLESILRELRLGAAAYQTHLGKVPDVYGRRRQGLTPVLPGILSRSGFEGALGFTLDDGVFPSPDQAKIRWEGLDASAIDSLGRTPLDAAKPETFLDLPRKIGEAMDRDYVATTLFAHWPGTTSPYYDDLRRMASYAPVLGKFITLSDYFQNTERPGQITKFAADKYRTTFYRQAVVRNLPNPITWVADAAHRRLLAESVATIETMTESVTLRGATTDAAGLLNDVDEHNAMGLDAGVSKMLTERVEQTVAAAVDDCAAALVGNSKTDARGLLLLNPQTASRRELVDVSELATLPTIGGPVVAVQETSGKKFAVVNVPGTGFAWLAAGPAVPPPRKPPKPIVLEDRISTDLFEIHVNKKSGGLQGVFRQGVRGNRLSQQLAFRLPGERAKPGDVWRDPDLEPSYTTMVCDALELTIVGPTVGEITTRGRLLDQERVVAKFTQRVRAAVGVPMLTLEIDLDVVEQPRAEPWGSYYASRFAWADESTTMARGVFLTHQTTTLKRPESPDYIELSTEGAQTLIVTDGLPFHVQTGARMLDTLLVCRGEERRRFRFGIVLDSQHPAQDALAFRLPLAKAPACLPSISGTSGRLFLVDAKNVVATHWESLVDDGRVIGFRVRLLETEGRAGRVELHAPRKMHSARQCDFRGTTLVDVPAGDDRIAFDLAAYEWIEIEAKY